MKQFVLSLIFLLATGIIVDLVGQTTVVKTSKGCFDTPRCIQSFFRYEEHAKEIDTLRGVSTYKAVDEENNLVIHVASWGGDYYCYINHNGDADWYDAEVLFNTEGIYQITLNHPFDNSFLGRIEISPNGALQFNWNPAKGGVFKVKLGFPVHMCWSDLKETKCKSYYSLFWKRPGEKQPWQLK